MAEAGDERGGGRQGSAKIQGGAGEAAGGNQRCASQRRAGGNVLAKLVPVSTKLAQQGLAGHR
jgi:hypothetical protein